MTLLGKIFTVMILLMSILFMGFAVVVFATHQNWKKIADNANPDVSKNESLGLKQQLERAEEKKGQLETEKELLQTQLAIEQASRRHALAALQTKYDNVKTRLLTRETEYQKLQSSHDLLVTTEQMTVANLKDVISQVADLRSQILNTIEDRDNKYLRVVALNEQLNHLKGQEDRLKTINVQLVKDKAKYARILRQRGFDVNVTEDTPPPTLRGIVTEVGSNRLVEVSIGSDDGLRSGHEMIVYRDSGEFVCRVKVVKTSTDRAVAQVDVKTQKSEVKVNDRVATKLRS